jgi:hypothetical protein
MNNLKKLRVFPHFIVAVHKPSQKVVRAFFLTRNNNWIRLDGMLVRFFKSHASILGFLGAKLNLSVTNKNSSSGNTKNLVNFSADYLLPPVLYETRSSYASKFLSSSSGSKANSSAPLGASKVPIFFDKII